MSKITHVCKLLWIGNQLCFWTLRTFQLKLGDIDLNTMGMMGFFVFVSNIILIIRRDGFFEKLCLINQFIIFILFN